MWLHSVRAAAEKAAVAMAHEALENVTKFGPQYSGQFVASWNLSVDMEDVTPRQLSGTSHNLGQGLTPTVYSEGDWPAISAALNANAGALKGFKLGHTIYLANNVSHEEPYSWKIERNQISFRDENPSKGRTLMRAEMLLRTKYAHIGKGTLAGLIK